MPGIYGMAVITISLTAILCIAFLNYLTHSDRRYLWLLLLGLPFSFIVNHWVKTPVITSLAAWANIPLKLGPEMPLWFIALILLNAPIFEEAIKMLPIVLPASRKFLNRASSSLWTGLALGMSFGLGEAAYIAYGLAQSPTYNSLPWYVFTGYLVERMAVTFAHGFMTAIAAYGFYRGGRYAFIGYFSAVGLHALINLGPILLALKLIPVAVSSFGSYIVILAAFTLFQKYARTAKKISGKEAEEIVYFER
jgi:RsiW-degrading membrane proteinase PrsW (M82 family)